MARERTKKEKAWQSEARSAVAEAWRTRPLASLASWIVGTPILLLAWLLRPLLRFRIGVIHCRAQGRLYANTEYYLRVRALNPPGPREIDVLVSGTPINRQVLTMIARRVPVIEADWLWRLLGLLQRQTPASPLWIDLSRTGWLELGQSGFYRPSEWEAAGPQLRFTEEEHVRGRALLRRLGIPEGSRHVCFFAKDRLYTDSPDTKLDPASYWGSRDFRNTDIERHLEAARWLADQGYTVLRMGMHRPERLIQPGHERVIDYTGTIRPTLDDPDFADTYLQATCRFFLGTGSASYLLSSIFGVPIAYANMVPFGECGRVTHDLYIFKKCRDVNGGKFLPYPALIARGVGADWLTLAELEALERDGIEFVENTPAEILDLVTEMHRRLEGTWQETDEDRRLQALFAAMYPDKGHDRSCFPGRYGAMFLRANPELFAP